MPTETVTSRNNIYINPHFMPLNEMVVYCEDNDGPVVQKAGEILRQLNEVMAEFKKTDPDEFFEELDSDIRDLRREIDTAEQDLDERESEVKELTRTVNSLRYDLTQHESARTIEYLKSELYEKNVVIEGYKKEQLRLNSSHAALTKTHRELQEKYNTWTAIAT